MQYRGEGGWGYSVQSSRHSLKGDFYYTVFCTSLNGMTNTPVVLFVQVRVPLILHKVKYIVLTKKDLHKILLQLKMIPPTQIDFGKEKKYKLTKINKI
jgi:hypothetical protein